MATAAPPQLYHICRCEVVDSKNQRKLLQERLNKLPLLWMAVLSLHTPECKVQL